MIFKATRRQMSENNSLNTENMADLHGKKTTTHQKENHDCRTECPPSVPEARAQAQTVMPNMKDSEIMIAADLKLYASPMTILQTCKKTNPPKMKNADNSSDSSSSRTGDRSSGGSGGSGDHMIAADLRKYGNPLDEK